MPKYDKLVRDKILEIIKAHGETPISRILHDDEEYIVALITKAAEEQQELAGASTLEQRREELADLEKVVQTLKQQLGVDEIDAISAKKDEKRGGFDKRIFLERTE